MQEWYVELAIIASVKPEELEEFTKAKPSDVELTYYPFFDNGDYLAGKNYSVTVKA